jgi:transcriptional regulator with XRE-family HTH domain
MGKRADARLRLWRPELTQPTAFAERVQGRLDRMDLSPEDAARAAGLPTDFLCRLCDGTAQEPRGERLIKLAAALETSISYLIGLDPDAPIPAEYLQEAQGSLGLLAGDEEALLRAYRRLDVSTRAALVQIVLKMAPDLPVHEKKPRHLAR